MSTLPVQPILGDNRSVLKFPRGRSRGGVGRCSCRVSDCYVSSERVRTFHRVVEELVEEAYSVLSCDCLGEPVLRRTSKHGAGRDAMKLYFRRQCTSLSRHADVLGKQRE
jgi:hypothetical protein